MAGRTLALIPKAFQPSRILDAGCGTGQFTEKLHDAFPLAEIEAVDAAGAMIEEAARRLPHARISWRTTDLTDFRASRPFDLVASSSSLHWVDPVEAGLSALIRAMEPQGMMVVSVMTEGTLGELHAARCIAAPDNPPRMRMLPARVWLDRIKMLGLEILDSREETETVYMETTADLLDMLRRQGVTGGNLSQGLKPLTRTDIRNLITAYENRFRTPKGIPASFRPLYILARRRARQCASP